MYQGGLPHALSLVVTQLEAASTLLKYAADDMREAGSRTGDAFRSELALVVANLADLTISIDANAAFCGRLVEELTEQPDGKDSVAQRVIGA